MQSPTWVDNTVLLLAIANGLSPARGKCRSAAGLVWGGGGLMGPRRRQVVHPPPPPSLPPPCMS